jgi:copper chaperone
MENFMKLALTIPDMTCNHCAARVEKALVRAYPNTDVHIDLSAKRAVLRGEGPYDRAALSSVIDDAGYTLEALETL